MVALEFAVPTSETRPVTSTVTVSRRLKERCAKLAPQIIAVSVLRSERNRVQVALLSLARGKASPALLSVIVALRTREQELDCEIERLAAMSDEIERMERALAALEGRFANV